jgi:putative flippase GtrA
MLPARFHGLTKEVAKFGIIGVINVVVNLGVANVLVKTLFEGSEVKAKAVAAIVATTSAYFMNRHWTYRDRPKSTLRREYTLFFFFNLIGLLIESGSVAVSKYWLHETSSLAFNVASGIGIALGTLFRFWSYRTHVFKVSDEADEEPAPLSFAAALADVPDGEESKGANLDLDAELEEAEPRLVVTSSAEGSVVIKIVESTDEIDEIDLDARARAT